MLRLPTCPHAPLPPGQAWVEFADKKVAKNVALMLNAQPVRPLSLQRQQPPRGGRVRGGARQKGRSVGRLNHLRTNRPLSFAPPRGSQVGGKRNSPHRYDLWNLKAISFDCASPIYWVPFLPVTFL